MKPAALLIACSLLLFSCNNKKEEPKKPVPEPVKTDTSSSGIKPDVTINQYAGVDVSPMDMSYFPIDYPKLKMTKALIAPPKARVIYSRPHLQGRQLFHEVLQYGEPWRLGANEATELDLYNDALIMDKKVKAGRYILYCIPGQDEWTIVLNSNIDSWGLQPDTSRDIARFVVPIRKISSTVEFYTMVFEHKKGANPELVMAWGNVEARLPFTF